MCKFVSKKEGKKKERKTRKKERQKRFMLGKKKKHLTINFRVLGSSPTLGEVATIILCKQL